MSSHDAPRDLVGLRDDDLSPDERRAVADHIASDPEAAAEADFARDLGGFLGGADPGGPSLADVRGRAARDDPWNWRPFGGGLIAMAAAAALFVLNPTGPDETGRDKGLGTAPVSVGLAAVAEGPTGPRPLARGAVVKPTERVVFWVDASVPGTVTLTEDGTRTVYPEGAAWTVAAGSHAPGGEQPLAWRAESPGLHTYTVELCPTDGACVSRKLALEWQ